MKDYIKTLVLCSGILAFGVVSSNAQYILGSFQGSGDPTDAGWVNPNGGASITTDSSSSFIAAGVSGYALSLDMAQSTNAFGNPSLELKFSPTQIAAFNANSYITFTFSVPGGTYTGGYSQIYDLVLNAPGYGYNNQSWANSQTSGNNANTTVGGDPNFYFNDGANSLQTQEVTLDYASVLSSIEAGGESYLQLTLVGNLGSGAPANMYFNNVVLSTSPFGVDAAPEPSTYALVGGALALAAIFRRYKK